MTKAERRDQIVAAARRVFLASGLSARIRDVAKEAAVNEALIYQHFESKDDLIVAAVVQPLEQVVRQLENTADALPPGSDTEVRGDVAEFMRQLLQAFVESVSLFGLVLFSDRDTGRAFYRAHVAPLVDAGIANVEASMGSWSHREFNPRVSVPASFGMCWWLALDADLRDEVLDVEATVHEITNLIFDGTVARVQPNG